MSSNFLFNIDIVNKKYPNKTDIYEDAIKEMLKIKKNINKFKKTNINDNINTKLNNFENQKKQINLEHSYKHSLILLNMMQKKIEKTIFEKYNCDIETNNRKIIKSSNDQAIQNILMKKKFLNNPY